MAAYPSFAQLEGSTWMLRDDIRVADASNGEPQQSGYYTVFKRVGLLLHKLVTADKETLEAFYLSNRLLVSTLVWAGDGLTYSMRFAGPPVAVWEDGRWTVEVPVAEA